MKSWISMTIFKSLIIVVMILLSVAFLTLLERKILSLMGLRMGPNKVSNYGLMQPIADALKLANKQMNLMSMNSIWFYYTSSILMFIMALMLWSTAAWNPPIMNMKFTVLMMMIILGLSTLKVILSGWSTFSKFPLLGMLRTMSQLISYESVIYLCLLTLVYFMGSFSLNTLSYFPITLLGGLMPITMMIWIPSMLADLNRTPYDFSESESELVSGFNTEFGSSAFTLIFLSEYSNILFMSLLTTMIFLSTQFKFTILGFLLSLFSILWIRATFPRIRFDKLMMMAWKSFIPIMTIYLLMIMLT